MDRLRRLVARRTFGGLLTYANTSLDQDGADCFAIHPHRSSNRTHRDAAEMELGCLRGFFHPEAWPSPLYTPPREVRRHRGAMHAVPVCQLVDRRTIEIVVNEAVYLGGGEKGLKMFNPPHHSAPRVHHRGGFRALRHPVDTPLPACDQGV